jgi:hypothetical protein
MTRRPATTLIEALMAIFVMAIGLLALLTLFPLGAVQMAQALKDQRTAEASNMATGEWKAYGWGNQVAVLGRLTPTNKTNFELPLPSNPNTSRGRLPFIPTNTAPTYPVYVDPLGRELNMGQVNIPGLGTAWTVGGKVDGITRTSVNIPVVAAQHPRWLANRFTLLDDITFAENGLKDPALPQVEREGRYTWAYMVRRVRAGASTLPLDLTVVVYSGRLPGTDSDGPIGERVYNAEYVSGNLVRITWTPGVDTKPALRRGGWVLDSRMTPTPQGWLYRVVSVNEVSANVVEVEVQQPLGGPLRSFGGSGPLVVMENVSEVFEKGTNY